MPARDFLILLGVCLVWAFNMIVAKLAVGPLAIPPLFFAGVRSALVAAVLVAWLRPLPRPFGKTMLVALAMGGGTFALLFLGLRTATASSAAIVGLASAPTSVLAAVVLLREVVHWRRILGIALSLGGVAVVLLGQGHFAASLGLGFVALSALTGGIGAVLLKTLDLEPLRLQAWSGASSMALLLPLSWLLEDHQTAQAGAAGWAFVGALAYSALAVSVGAHTVYFWLLGRHDVNVIAPLTLLNPLLTVVLGALLMDEPVTRWLFAGGTLALAGVLIIVLRPSRTLPKELLLRGRT